MNSDIVETGSQYILHGNKPLDRGTYGQVYACTPRYTAGLPGLPTDKYVAKVYTFTSAPERVTVCTRERLIMAALQTAGNNARERHANRIGAKPSQLEAEGCENVVQLIGSEHVSRMAFGKIYTESHPSWGYIVMERVPHQLEACFHTLTPREVIKVIKGIVRGMMFIHNQGIIHRDFKMSNVLIDTSGNAQIIDFSHSIFDTGDISRTDKRPRITSVLYCPPDLYWGNSDYSFDIDSWAVGVVILELLHGVVFDDILRDTIGRTDNVSHELLSLLMKLEHEQKKGPLFTQRAEYALMMLLSRCFGLPRLTTANNAAQIEFCSATTVSVETAKEWFYSHEAVQGEPVEPFERFVDSCTKHCGVALANADWLCPLVNSLLAPQGVDREMLVGESTRLIRP